MSNKIIKSDKAPEPIGPYSQAVQIDKMVFLSGQIAIDRTTGNLVLDSIENETVQVMENLKFVLEAADLNFTHVVKCSIFLSDMNNFPRVNEVYGRYFQVNPPARETVEVRRLPKDVNVEISCIAVKG